MNAKKEKTIKLPIFLSLVLSIAIIILILYWTLDAQTFDYLTSVPIRYEFFAVAILLNVLYWFLWGARLQVLSNAIDEKVHIGWWESTKIVIANMFLASITPSMAGGEPVRIHLLTKDGLSLGGATASVLGERLLDAIFLLICVPFAILLFKDRITNEYISTGLMIGVAVFIIAIIVFAYAIKSPEKAKSFVIWVNRKLSRFSKKKESERSVVTRINREVDNFHNSMMFFLTEGRGAFFKAGILTVVFWSTGFMIPSMILLGLGLDPFVIESYAAQILIIVIIMMPTTPGSTGVAEGGMAGLYGVLIGTTHEYLLGVFVLLFRLITYHMNLIAGAIFQYRIFKSVASFSLEKIKKER